jgi:cysteine-rich repeat protein
MYRGVRAGRLDAPTFAATGRWSSGTTGWQVLWDTATGVPARLFGRGIPAPDTVASASAAERVARAVLAERIELLAPGAHPDDFRLASNHVDDGLRTVGFLQYHRGVRVLGGQISFRFKRDRLVAIASEALPHVQVRGAGPILASEQIRPAALSWPGGTAPARLRNVDGPYLLPRLLDHRVAGYRLVHRALVASGHSELWEVFVDALTGAPVERRQALQHASGTIFYNVPDRYPERGRINRPAQGAHYLVAGAAALASDLGVVSWDGNGELDIAAQVTGRQVEVVNDAGERAAAAFTLAPGSAVTWDARDDEFVDAQLSTFIYTTAAKEYARRFAGTLPFLDQQLRAVVNLGQQCNAFFDGNAIHFFTAGAGCENTGRLADVVYHEFGHALHVAALLPGAGNLDAALSEGLADYLAITITNDPGMGRGFFHDDEPLRQLDPAHGEQRWPEDVGEVHQTGTIIAGALWDLRKALIALHGHEAGVTRADRLFYAVMQRAADISSSYVEVLVADDDDGDLANGTPNICAINQAFGRHGLRIFDARVSQPGAQPPEAAGTALTLRIDGLQPTCPGDAVQTATVEWHLRDAPDRAGSLSLAPSGVQFAGLLPPQEQTGVVRYRVRVDFGDGSSLYLPANPADPFYEMFVGTVVPLYCSDFESDPFAAGWSHGLLRGSADEGADDWQWGAPQRRPGSWDPNVAHSGLRVLGNDLGAPDYDGLYQPEKLNYLLGPAVATGRYSDVRLHYWRWLSVEDGHYDRATITANRQSVWYNLDSDEGESSSTHHRDQEWRFHDVPLSRAIEESSVQVMFELASDGGLEFGGWNVDDLCIVAVADSICGDGRVTGAEQCDQGDGNSDVEIDGCRMNCRLAHCGDGTVDSDEACDDGNRLDGDACTARCGPPPVRESGGCRVPPAGGTGPGAWWLLLALLAPGLRACARSRAATRRMR